MSGHVIDILGTAMASLFVAYLIYLRLKRKSIMEKYKPGSTEYTMYTRLLNPIYLIGAVVVMLGFAGSLIYHTKRTGTHISDFHPSAFIVLLVSLVVIGTFLSAFNKYKKK